MVKKSSKSTVSEAHDRLGDVDQPATHAPGLLAAAVEATQTGSPCFAHMVDIAPLLTHPSGQLVEYNDAMTDGNGRIALRATAAGVQVFQTNGNGASAPEISRPQHGPEPSFIPPAFAPQNPTPFASAPVVGSHTAIVFKKGIPFPGKAKRTRSSQYNFDTMEVGDCFDTMPTGDNPEPWKRLASAASAASKRFDPKVFETLPVEEKGIKFARTWRTA